MEQSQNLFLSTSFFSMLLSVLIQLPSQRKRKKSTRRDGTEPKSLMLKDKTVSHKSKLHSFVPKPPRRNKCSNLFCYLPVRSFYSSVQWGYKKRGTKSLWS